MAWYWQRGEVLLQSIVRIDFSVKRGGDSHRLEEKPKG